MSRMLPVAVLATIAIGGTALPLTAQARSTIDAAALDRAVTTPAPATDARAALTTMFATVEGKAALSRVGLTPDAAAARLALLDDAAADRLADRVLAGGRGSVVISTTAIIIILLVLILITD